MYVFEGCAAFLRTVPLMQFSKSCPEDLDTAMEDHVCDEWRYACICSSLPRPGRWSTARKTM